LSASNFHAWVSAIFQTPPDKDIDRIVLSPALSCEYIHQLFSNSRVFLTPFSKGQVNRGLWYIIDCVQSSELFSLIDETVPLSVRLKSIDSIFDLFRDYFSVECSDHLSHLDEPGASPINSVCYMWWDIAPVYGKSGESAAPNWVETDKRFIEVMERTLNLPSIACQESALHGLGHWQCADPKRIEPVIDRFLSQKVIRPELREYALAARKGMVQ
jgi:hypothetical protein